MARTLVPVDEHQQHVVQVNVFTMKQEQEKGSGGEETACTTVGAHEGIEAGVGTASGVNTKRKGVDTMNEPMGKKRELKRDTKILQEFDDSSSPDLLVLYYHLRDMDFDCFNASEFHQQMIRYYAGMRLKTI